MRINPNAIMNGMAEPLVPRLPEMLDPKAAVTMLLKSPNLFPPDEAIDIVTVLVDLIGDVYHDCVNAVDYWIGENVMMSMAPSVSSGWKFHSKKDGMVTLVHTGVDNVFVISSQRITRRTRAVRTLESYKDHPNIIREEFSREFSLEDVDNINVNIIREELEQTNFFDTFSREFSLEDVDNINVNKSVTYYTMLEPKDFFIARLICPQDSCNFYQTFDNTLSWIMENVPSYAAVYFGRLVFNRKHMRISPTLSPTWCQYVMRYNSLLIL